ncbi:TPA: hypothetical protein QCO67_005953 [Bacillus cereus]|nr:hypothetical protein [Bacillus cereus]HDR3659077.1 hypothetical protein [Bacillus cereus]HDR3913852.1 hypothetical protein [Bacillus cereus]HDR3915119.1 hypothetical protein [Bacillus cereus]HDV7170734.1 hypothetical protein [Bacillus cereus]
MNLILGIFIIYTNQSIGKESDKMNYESRENFINKEKDSRGKRQSKYNESSFASIQAVVNKEYGLPEDLVDRIVTALTDKPNV